MYLHSAQSHQRHDRTVFLLENLDPRQHIAARIGWAVFLIIALVAPLCAWLVAKETENYFRQAATHSLRQSATQVHREIAANLQSRLSVISLVATQLQRVQQNPESLTATFNTIQAKHPEFNWIGLADGQGSVVASANNVFVGENVSQLLWFKNGLAGDYLGDLHNAPRLEKLLPRASTGSSFKVIDVAVPVYDDSGSTTGVLGAQLSWNWVRNLQALSLSSLDSNTPRIELILASQDNTVISGPADLFSQPLPDETALSESGKFVLGVQSSAYSDPASLDWTVVLRGDGATAIAAGRSAQGIVIITIMSAGLIAALLILFAVSKLTRKLRVLSNDAQMIARGEKSDLQVHTGADEVSQIGQVLATSIKNLQHEKNTLQSLNSELDQRVADRTKTIARLSAESREIALTQQRLRFARDMHDTLAHSMMAVLTQIRLVRKVRKKLSDTEVEEELRRAEDVALNGLNEARNAITEVRSNNVQDHGISGALHSLTERLRNRTGLRYTLRLDPQSIHQQDDRSETIYRIVEEALRNIEKHANASEVTINLDLIEQSSSEKYSMPLFKLEIIDDGNGFDTDRVASGHYGLIGLREQAALIDGELSINSTPGSGTTIRLTYMAYKL